MEFDNNSLKLSGKSQFGMIALIIGIIGLLASGYGYVSDAGQFFHSYLVAFFFWLSIGLGGLFFTMLHHIVDAKWSIVVRRFTENIMMTLPIFVILIIPLFFGLGELFHWTHPEVVAQDELLTGKAPYLNTTFFIIRTVVIFAIWIIFASALYKLSVKQDSGHKPEMVKKFRRLSAAGIILFALSSTFFSFDWLMSLDAHWYSTIFGVYIFAGVVLAVLSVLDITIMRFNAKGILDKVISDEHYHDIGKLMFAFIIFWGYMAFSQYFLIWYGNIPEETVWFLHRWGGSWKVVTMIIVFGHFVIPFFALFPMFVKRNRIYMILMSLWILLMHWVDLYWIVMPNYHHHGVHISWIDVSTFVGIGGIFLFCYMRRLSMQPLIPIGDPGLEESKNFVNF